MQNTWGASSVQFATAAVLLIIAYIYAIHFAVSIGKHKGGWQQKLNRVHESQIITIDGEVGRALTSGRGQHYYIGATTPEKRERLESCVMTFWGLAHFGFFAVLGFACPDLFWETFAIGCGFEVYEKVQFDCHDLLDIIWNTLGFAAGRAIRQTIGKKPSRVAARAVYY